MNGAAVPAFITGYHKDESFGRDAVPASSASVLMLVAVSMLFVPGFQVQPETLGGVAVSGWPCLPFGNQGMIHQHPLLLVYTGIDFCMGLGLYRK